MNDETKTKLAEIRAKREAVEARRAARSAESELETETRALDEAETLDKLEAEHGPVGKGIGYVRTSGGLLVVKKPAGASYRKYADSNKATTQAAIDLVMGCAIYPAVKAEFRERLDEFAAALVPLTSIAVRLAGFQDPEGKE